MEPLVSVIIPNYNHAAFLKERLETVINQTYPNFEIIILDDASTDTSKTIIEEYQTKEKVTSIIYNLENSGSPFLQWKKGIELARGEFIWIAESDDVSRLNFLETLVPILAKDSKLMLVYSDTERDNSNWKKIEQLSNIQVQTWEGEKFVRQKMLTSPVIVNSSAVIFKKEAVQKSILMQSGNYKSLFDWLFWCSIILKGNIAFYPAKLNFFRQHSNSTSLNAAKQGLFVIEGLQVILYLKNVYNINLSFLQIKIWSSLYAQTYLLLGSKRSILLKANKQAWLVSPQISIYFIYYLIKFRFFSPTNIKI